jgi:hypothetical protein
MDDGGRSAAIVMLDPDDLDAAYAELNERYAAGEAAPYARTWEAHLRFEQAVAARDWAQLTSYASDYVMDDHRPLGLLPRSREEYVASVRAMIDLRPDAMVRTHHVLALGQNRSLAVIGFVGKEAEGAFDISAVVVSEFGPDGLRRSTHAYEPEQLDEAWARFEALGAATD